MAHFPLKTRNLMRFVATLIGQGPETLSEAHAEGARQALSALGAETAAADWLADGIAADLMFDDLDPDQADAAIRLAIADAPVDCIAQPRERRRKRLLVADMESTIIEQEMLDELATLRGIGPAIALITARAMNGEIDFVGALRERVGLLAGLPESSLATVARRITYMPGARALVATMRRAGARAILVSGGFTQFAEGVARALGFDAVFANRLELGGGAEGARTLTGGVHEPVLGRDDKLARLVEEAGRDRIPLSETLAVGDGANDLPMLQAAGLGVAFRAKPVVRAAARARVDHADLTALLYAQGFREAEIAPD
jgi:phosphoserine phosphatase